MTHGPNLSQLGDALCTTLPPMTCLSFYVFGMSSLFCQQVLYVLL